MGHDPERRSGVERRTTPGTVKDRRMIAPPVALIVESDPEVCHSTQEWLRVAGWAPACAASLAEARRLLEETRFDLVLLDLTMPDGHGLDLLPEVRTRSPLTDVVIVTSVSTLAEAVEAIRIGVVDFVQKPLSQEDFIAMLRRLSVRRSLREGRVEQKVDHIATMIALIMDRLGAVESELDVIRTRL